MRGSKQINALSRLKTTEDMFAALTGEPLTSLPIREVREVVAELIAAVEDVYGNPSGEPCKVPCPSCRIRAALANATGEQT